MDPRKNTSAATRGCWKGSKATAGDIRALVHARKMLAEVLWGAPGAEVVSDARAGERVVFLTHFERGFGLRPARSFATSSTSTVYSRTTSQLISSWWKRFFN